MENEINSKKFMEEVIKLQENFNKLMKGEKVTYIKMLKILKSFKEKYNLTLRFTLEVASEQFSLFQIYEICVTGIREDK
ncbi:MAG: hypothetical protein RRY22_04230 [Bacilli bacterium]